MSFIESIKWTVEDAVDRASDLVQNATGEADRRAYMAALKNKAAAFKRDVSAAVDQLNQEISRFNERIISLNALRKNEVSGKIGMLFAFLGKFGACKPCGAYTDESTQIPTEFPQRELDAQEHYIRENDWSKEEVFWNTFFRSFVGMKKKTRDQNLRLQEAIHDTELRARGTLDQLSLKGQKTAQDIEICDMYMSNVSTISAFIQDKIIPELELVEAFFQAAKIKDEILSDHTLENPVFSYQLSSIIGTPYEKHYRFVKNTFMFYVLSCKIYDTPVLTNLLRQETSHADIAHLREEREALNAQARTVQAEMTVNRGGVENE